MLQYSASCIPLLHATIMCVTDCRIDFRAAPPSALLGAVLMWCLEVDLPLKHTQAVAYR